jgi:YcaO-like protein with predicted kinase domain
MPIELFGRALTAKKEFVDGTHRTRSPAATLAAYRPYLAGMGITRLSNVTGLDTIGVPVFTAIRPNSRSLATSQGKGLDAAGARVSAMMESIELWHAEHVALPLRRESYEELRKSASVIDVARLPVMAGKAFQPERRILWVEGYDLAQHRALWVPHDLVCVDQLIPEATFCQSSNGLASGNHLLEATVHGLCEVIERDAETLWRLSRETPRRLALSTVADPYCVEVLRRIAAAGATVAVWDITSDVGVPTYACLLIDPPSAAGWRGVGFYDGFGTHTAREVALARALTEAVQVRVTYVAGNRDDLYRDTFQAATNRDTWHSIWNEIANETPNVRFDHRPSIGTDSFDGDLHVLRDALVKVGIDNVVVVDLTRPDLGIPVVKVIVPGLEAPAGWADPGPRARRVLDAQDDSAAQCALPQEDSP